MKKTIRESLRLAEKTYQNLIHQNDYTEIFLPHSFFGFLILLLSTCCPELGSLLLFNYMLTSLSNKKIPYFKDQLLIKYENFLEKNSEKIVPSNNMKILSERYEEELPEYILTQNTLLNLIPKKNSLLKTADFVLKNNIFHSWNERIRILTSGNTPSFFQTLSDQIYRENLTEYEMFSLLNSEGACYGLLKTWYAYVSIGEFDKFFDLLASIITKKGNNLNEEERKFIWTTHEIQKKQHQVCAIKINDKLVTIKKTDLKKYLLRINSNNPLESYIVNVVDQIFELLKKNENLNKLVFISLSKGNAAHALGLVNCEAANHLYFFDANFIGKFEDSQEGDELRQFLTYLFYSQYPTYFKSLGSLHLSLEESLIESLDEKYLKKFN